MAENWWESSPLEEEKPWWESSPIEGEGPSTPQEPSAPEPMAQEPEDMPSETPEANLTLAERLGGMIPRSLQELATGESEASGFTSEPKSASEAGLRSGLGAYKNEAVGALKGLGQLGIGAVEAAKEGGRRLGILSEDVPAAVDGARKRRTLSERIRSRQAELGLEPEGLFQNLGALASKTLPAAAISGGASLPAQIGTGALLSGGQALIEGGSPTEVGVSTALGGLAPGLARGVKGYAGHLGKSATELYEKALHATRGPLKKVSAEIVPQLLKKGVHGSLKSLAERGAAESERVGGRIAKTYERATRSGKVLDKKAILEQLGALKEEFLGRADKEYVKEAARAIKGRRGNPESIGLALQGKYVRNPQAVSAINSLTRRVEQASPDPEEMWRLRREFDAIVGKSGWKSGLDPGSQKAIARDARAVITDELDKAHPSIKNLNKAYKLWQGLEDVASETALRKTGQQNAPGIVARGAGAIVGAAVPGGAMTKAAAAVATSKAAALLEKTFRSPSYRTWSAVKKAKLADLIVEGNADKIVSFLGRAAGPVGTWANKPDIKRDVEAQRIRRQLER